MNMLRDSSDNPLRNKAHARFIAEVVQKNAETLDSFADLLKNIAFASTPYDPQKTGKILQTLIRSFVNGVSGDLNSLIKPEEKKKTAKANIHAIKDTAKASQGGESC